VRGVVAFTLAAEGLAIFTTQCQPQPVEERRPAQVIWVTNDWQYPFNAEGGDTLNLIMNTDDIDAAREECDHVGGKFVDNWRTQVMECHDVDF
jgi:hypothetical protein